MTVGADAGPPLARAVLPMLADYAGRRKTVEPYERGQPATDIEQDLGEPGYSIETLDTGRAGSADGVSGVGPVGTTKVTAADVEREVAEPRDAGIE